MSAWFQGSYTLCLKLVLCSPLQTSQSLPSGCGREGCRGRGQCDGVTFQLRVSRSSARAAGVFQKCHRGPSTGRSLCCQWPLSWELTSSEAHIALESHTQSLVQPSRSVGSGACPGAHLLFVRVVGGRSLEHSLKQFYWTCISWSVVATGLVRAFIS